MLRQAQHERKFLDDFEIFSVRHFDKLSAGSEAVEVLRKSFSTSCALEARLSVDGVRNLLRP